ncbi:MAG: twin transmembrane helix small protein [Burkholderiaceae bacterium]|nr:twin transmembrane helix small protein [Burkholderiaceae bacterium]
MKIVVIIAFILIIASLGSALVFMMKDKDKGKNNRMATALTFRVAFSIALFLLLLFSYKMGWIQPTGFIVGR